MRGYGVRLVAAAVAALGLVAAAPPAGDGQSWSVTARKRVPVTVAKEVVLKDGTKDVVVLTEVRTVTEARLLDPTKTAVVVCDMWDDHWCKSAAKRCGELAKQAEPVLAAARGRGVTIIHAPSDCMTFYADHPARKRAQAVTKVEPPKPKDIPSPPLPVDDSDGGCDDDPPPKQRKAWTRQHPAITIDPARDFVTDQGAEVYSILKEKGITTLVVMGVHTNMCVLNRSFAIKQMRKWGVDTYLVRDLTDAMYNPKMRPFVPHERGTELIIEHIETYWCPSITGKDLAGGK
jgi:nicotinamidase-related amidase